MSEALWPEIDCPAFPHLCSMLSLTSCPNTATSCPLSSSAAHLPTLSSCGWPASSSGWRHLQTGKRLLVHQSVVLHAPSQWPALAASPCSTTRGGRARGTFNSMASLPGGTPTHEEGAPMISHSFKCHVTVRQDSAAWGGGGRDSADAVSWSMDLPLLNPHL